MPSVLIITRSEAAARSIAQGLGDRFRVETRVGDAAKLQGLARDGAPVRDVVFVDLELTRTAAPRDDCFAWLKGNRPKDPLPEIIVLTPRDQVQEAIQCIEAGAGDYLTLPIDVDQVRLVAATLERTLRHRRELNYLRREVQQKRADGVLKSHNAHMEEVFAKAQAVAAAGTTVLLTGETGTGKGVLARMIHRLSPRSSKPFVAVHCGAIQDTLLESELFGHEKGAFTGAVRRKLGKFEIARSGTIFLDEIGTLTGPAQIRLLQILQERTFSRVGGERDITADVRVIAAANTDLDRLSEQGKFRRDLFYRLNVFPIELPPLRERSEDIPRFIDYFLERLNRESRKQIREVSPKALEALCRYAWPGNIRELENLIERAFILETGERITLASLPADFAKPVSGTLLPSRSVDLPLAEARQRVVERFEKHYLQELLARHQGRIDRSALQAGISTRQIHKLLARYGIHKEDYKSRSENSRS